jgi:hypothetical protein
MRPIYAVMAGLAVIAATGLGAFANEPKSTVHEMTIELPNGGVEHIRYKGDVRPHVTVRKVPASQFETWFNDDAVYADPFVVSFCDMSAQMSRIANEIYQLQAAMHRRMQLMMREADEMARLSTNSSDALMKAGLTNTAPGSVSYSYVSTSTGNGTCTRTVQVTTQPNGKPQVVSKSSGNCADRSLSAPAPVLERREPARGTLSISAQRDSAAAIPAVYSR